jgi:hypothetical protein
MAEAKKQKIVKKKIRPYPIEAQLEFAGAKHSVEIVYLTSKGCIALLKSASMIFVGKYYHVIFEIPVLREWINTQVRAMKTYDRSVDPKNHVVERLAEFRFQTLTEEQGKHIAAFTDAIGQR